MKGIYPISSFRGKKGEKINIEVIQRLKKKKNQFPINLRPLQTFVDIQKIYIYIKQEWYFLDTYEDQPLFFNEYSKKYNQKMLSESYICSLLCSFTAYIFPIEAFCVFHVIRL